MNRTLLYSVIFFLSLPGFSQSLPWRFGFENNELDPPIFCTEAQFDTLMSRMRFITSSQPVPGGTNHNGIGGGWDFMQTGPGATLNFSNSDTWISRFQRGGFEIVFELNPTAAWAQVGNTHCINGLGEDECAPGPEFWDDWHDYIQQLAERYDGDGIDDMPGLTIPVHYFTMTQEVYFAGDADGDQTDITGSGFWDDNMNDLIELHRVAYQALQDANANGGNSKLQGSGGLLFDLWADFPDYPDPEGSIFNDRINGDNISGAVYKNGIDSLKKLLMALNDTIGGKKCDVLGWHPHANWKSVDMTMAWIRQYNQQPMLIEDMWVQLMPCTYPNDGWYQFTDVNETERDFPTAEIPDVTALYNGLNTGDADITNWYNAKIARDLVKSFSVVFAWGAERAEYSGNCDNPFFQNWGAGNPFSTFAYSNLLYTRDDNYALKPQAHTMKLLVDKIHDFTSVQKIDISDDPYTRCYKFIRDGRPDCYILWSESTNDPVDPHTPDGETVTIPVVSTSLTETHIITSPGTASAEIETIGTPDHSLTIQLGFEPVFIEETQFASVNDPEVQQINIYPNPVSDVLHISTPTQYEKGVITDITGKNVLTFSGTESVQVNTLPAGFYFIRLFDKNNSLTGIGKFVKL